MCVPKPSSFNDLRVFPELWTATLWIENAILCNIINAGLMQKVYGTLEIQTFPLVKQFFSNTDIYHNILQAQIEIYI